MSRGLVVRQAVFFSLLATCCRSAAPATQLGELALEDAGTVLYARASALHDQIVTIDSHAGFTGDPLRTCGETDRQVDLVKMRHGGINAVFFIVYAGQGPRTDAGYGLAIASANQAFHDLEEILELCAAEVELARSPEDVHRIAAGGKLAIAIGMENGFMLGPDLTLLQDFAERGVAYLGLTHNGHNAIADAATARDDLGDLPSEHGGVSSFGERVIAELNDLGIMIDLSHLSKDAALDAIEISRAPVIASHSSMHALVPHPRNMDDETLQALARKGGVVQITPVHELIKVDPPGAMEAFHALLDEFGLENDSQARNLPRDRQEAFERRNAALAERWPLATVADFVDHIDHVV